MRIAVTAVLALATPAQEGLTLIEVYATAIAGDSVYVDAGRLAGLEPGDRVVFHPPSAAAVYATVRSVSRTSARAEFDGQAGVSVGDRGEVRIPTARLTPRAGSSGADPGRDEPEWEAPTVPWDTERPLLAAPVSRAPDARPSELSGRIFTIIDQTWDSARDQRFLLLRQGLDARLTNPFGQGGALRLDAEAFRRESRFAGASDTDDSGRIDRLSYAWGGTRDEATRAEVGRFLSYEFPELGVIDGVEVVQRTSSGARFGSNLGFFPDPTSDFRTGDDVQASVFYRSPRAGEGGRRCDWGVAWQNTWNRGDKDRSLVIGGIDYRPTDQLSFSAASQVDHYGHGDTIKSSGLELTEIDVRARYNFELPIGVGTYYSRRRWPELLRNTFANLTPDQIRNNLLERVGLDAWTLLRDTVRVSVRADTWRDEDDSGSSGSARLAAREWLYDAGEVSLDVFATSGSFSSTDGFRVNANKQVATWLIGISYEDSRATQDNFLGTQGELAGRRARLHFDATLAKWNVSTYFETRFGDEQRSLIAGLFLQYKF